MMKYLQRLGKALMLPVACLPVCGILMGIGYAMSPHAMQGGDITGMVEIIGFFLIKAGGALIDNMSWLFAVGVAVGLANDKDGTAGLAGLVSWLMITKLLNPSVVSVLTGVAADAVNPAYSKIETQFIGILAGVIGAACYNKFKDTKLPDALSFFSGKRCVAIVTAIVSIVIAGYPVLCMAGCLRRTGFPGWRDRQPRCYRRWCLRFPQPSAHSVRSAPCTQLGILVRCYRHQRPGPVLGRRNPGYRWP